MPLTISQRLIVGVLLVCHLATATALLPLAVLGLAVLDGTHGVSVEYGERGPGVRLHHREGDFTPRSCNEHTVAGWTMDLFCRSSSEGDHVLEAATLPPNTEVKKLRDQTTTVTSTLFVACELPALQIQFAAPRTYTLENSEVARSTALLYHRLAIASVQLLV